jgi:hypothetical protein
MLSGLPCLRPDLPFIGYTAQAWEKGSDGRIGRRGLHNISTYLSDPASKML